jgi:hypothetical protein
MAKSLLWLLLFCINSIFFIILGHYIAKKLLLRVFVMALAIGTSIFMGTIVENHLTSLKLDAFDLDRDGIFSEYEHTPEQREYFLRSINNTHQFFYRVIAFPYAFFISITSCLMIALIRCLTGKRTGARY